MKIDTSSYIAKEAIIIGDVKIEKNCCILHYVTIRGDVSYIYIGEQTNIQEHCTLHVSEENPIILGEKVSVGHKVILHGCKIGNKTMIGMGAIIMDGVIVGDNCIIGAGSLLTQNTIIPDNSIVFGSPGIVKRSITKEEIQFVLENSEKYKEIGKKLKQSNNNGL